MTFGFSPLAFKMVPNVCARIDYVLSDHRSGVDEEWSCESSFHGQNVRLVTNIMLCRKELSRALKSIRDIPLLSRAYRVAVLFNPVLSDDRPY